MKYRAILRVFFVLFCIVFAGMTENTFINTSFSKISEGLVSEETVKNRRYEWKNRGSWDCEDYRYFLVYTYAICYIANGETAGGNVISYLVFLAKPRPKFSLFQLLDWVYYRESAGRLVFVIYRDGSIEKIQNNK